ncbi:MAG: molybdopterin cofactor-binding domain-containing protein [Anaerolineae bacterium]|nr:molybdopterin-dependent oxidoreductase [Anaerolineae bacterium]MDW8103070.1 molybdopterin cofactor-binding domain-containing protein [Anaerolineae bacterium]
MRKFISLKINGENFQVDVDKDTSLLEVLRDHLHLTGTKKGCGEGLCGSCTVIVNGKAVRSCTYKAVNAEGASVETIESLAREGKLHPLQKAFIDYGAIQCGFCTPGMIMSAKALLDQNPSPSDEEIIKAIQPNLCRCTGYSSIVRAIKAAASEIRGEGYIPPTIPSLVAPLKVVGNIIPKPDAILKATGKALYAADLYFEGMLYAKVLRSSYPHARILRIDTTRARNLPGVVAVLTAEDVPGDKTHGVVRKDWPVFAMDKVRYIGDAIAMVVAEREEIASEALKLIEVDYEPLPVVTSPQEALKPDAPKIHEGGNLLKHISIRRGNVDEAFTRADLIVERVYRTPTYEHAFLEPEAGVATVDPDGNITVYVGSQIPFLDRRQIAESLAIPEEKVRVVGTFIGGAFGGKEDISVQIHVALAAFKTGRPVKLVFSREESMKVHPKRHATTIRLKTGATKEGKLLALEAEIYGDAGAYASLSEHVMTRTATHISGPYQIPNLKVDCYAVYTNNPPSGAFRGFGVPQAAFAIESQMDIMAEELGLSPLEIRKINALRAGTKTPLGQLLEESVGLLETLDRVEEEMKRTPFTPIEGTKRRAWGIACAFKNVGLGGGVSDKAGAEVEVTEEGTIIVRAGAADLGGGLSGVIAAIVAEEFGLPGWQAQDIPPVKVILADTGCTPEGGPTTASRQSFITGNAVRFATRRVKDFLSRIAAEEMNVHPMEIVFEGGFARAGDKALSLGELVSIAKKQGQEARASYFYEAPTTVPISQEGPHHFAFGFATQGALVEVDMETGEVRVLKVIAAHDVGKAISPLGVVGQIEGGVMMGIGLTLKEEFVLRDGIPMVRGFKDYQIPRAKDMPEIVPVIVEAPSSAGPFGAKGIGEIPSIPTSPAIVNAIYKACGVRFYHLPVKSQELREKLWQKLT